MNAEQWNRLYPVGTEVFVTDDADGEQYHTRTRSEAWTHGSGAPVVALEGYSCYHLAGVTPVEPVGRHTIHQPFGLMERMPLAELLDMMASHGVAKIASVFGDQDSVPIFAVVLLTGDGVSHYLAAFDQVEARLEDEEEARPAAPLAAILDRVAVRLRAGASEVSSKGGSRKALLDAARDLERQAEEARNG